MSYRSDIEGLRAVAVLVVLLYHFGVPGFDGGFIGVDVFFVISGFLITSLLIDERATGRISITSFYARRARRLLPISAVVLVATALGSALLLSATRLRDIAQEITWSSLFGANLLFAHRGTNYLTAALETSPLRHYWSLAVEEQFYLVWPALIALVTFRAHDVRRRIAVTMAIIVAVSFSLSVLLTAESPSWSYFGPHTRAWELGVGALLAACAPAVMRLDRRLRARLGWVGLAVIVVCAVTFGGVTQFPGWVAALPVLATAAVLAASTDSHHGPDIVLRLSPLQYIGSRSYSLYLWHWPILIVATEALERRLSALESMVAAAGVLLMAELGFRWVEQPLRRSRPLIQRPRWSIAVGAGLIMVGVATGVAVGDYEPDVSTGVVAAAPAPVIAETTTTSVLATPSSTSSTLPPAPVPISMVDSAPLAAIVDALDTTVLPDNLRPPLMGSKGDTGTIYDDGCHQYYQSAVNPACEFGDPTGTTTIAIWGDSHAAQWFTALDTIARSNGWRLLSLTQGGCPYLDEPVFNRSDNVVFSHCAPWRRSVRAYMVEQDVDVVFLSEHYGLRSAADQQPFSLDTWSRELPEVLASLRADGIEPIVIGDTPDPPKAMPGCLSENRLDISVCHAAADEPRGLERTDLIRALTAAAGVGFIEPGRWICASNICPVVVGDLLAYRDGDHLSNTFVEWLAPALAAVVVPFIERHIAAQP